VGEACGSTEALVPAFPSPAAFARSIPFKTHRPARKDELSAPFSSLRRISVRIIRRRPKRPVVAARARTAYLGLAVPEHHACHPVETHFLFSMVSIGRVFTYLVRTEEEGVWLASCVMVVLTYPCSPATGWGVKVIRDQQELYSLVEPRAQSMSCSEVPFGHAIVLTSELVHRVWDYRLGPVVP
jgi:hypothetical protein